MQDSLFASGALQVHTDAPIQRTWLDDDSWVDVAHCWLGGQLELYDRLSRADMWHRGRRPMYGEMVDEPRLSAGLRLRDSRTPAVVRRMSSALGSHYGLPMSTVWLNWYQSGDDAVAWHSDRIGRAQKDPPVAIISLGSTRRFLLRPKGGGRSVTFTPAGGDLLVMGGACQHRWEHSVPRSRRGGPRISVTLRPPSGGRTSDGQRLDWAPGRTKVSP
ncbi:alpha-ketoglutarate-dependent dioxygenase AlkB [soil metagenome]